MRDSKRWRGCDSPGQRAAGRALGKTGPDGRFTYAFTAGNKGPLLFAADYIEQAAPTANYERGEYATSLHFVR